MGCAPHGTAAAKEALTRKGWGFRVQRKLLKTQKHPKCPTNLKVPLLEKHDVLSKQDFARGSRLLGSFTSQRLSSSTPTCAKLSSQCSGCMTACMPSL